MQPYSVPLRPWWILGADMFELGQQQFFILVDYWSGFFEVQEVKEATSTRIISPCKVQFSRHGISDVLVTDNGTQFTSSAFSRFAKEWQFEHRTSSPYYPQSNVRAENAVKTCKSLMKKAKVDGQDPLLALLDWRNTPTEGIGTSPVQRLMGRRTRTLLPTHENLLIPPSHKDTAAKLSAHKSKQVRQYYKKCRWLEPLKCGQTIRMRLPGRQEWTLGTCTRVLKNRSYEVEVCGKHYRRNRRQLRQTPEMPPALNSVYREPEPLEFNENPTEAETGAELSEPKPRPVTATGTEFQPPDTDTGPEKEPREMHPRRSDRRRLPPAWHQDYQMY